MILNTAITKDKLNYYLLLLLAFLIPLKKELLAPSIILFFLSSFFNFNPKKEQKPLLLIVFFYAIGLLSLLYTNNSAETWFNAEIKLSIAVLPLAFYFSNLNYNFIYPSVLKAFVEGCLIAVIINTILSSIRFYYERDPSLFFYDTSSSFAHVSYYGYYLTFAIAILYYFLFNPNKQNYIPPLYLILLIGLFSLVILIGTSKAAVISLIITHFISALYWILKYKKYKQGILTLLFFSIAIAVTFTFSESFKSRFMEMKNSLYKKELPANPNSSTTMRLAAWQQAIELIKEKPFIGYGTGDVVPQLTKKYKKNHYDSLAKRHLNTHNQFLQIMVGSGVFAFIYFIFLLLFPFFKTSKIHFLYLLFVIITFINFATESMLETQSGVVFFSFALGLFYSIIFSKKTTLLTK